MVQTVFIYPNCSKSVEWGDFYPIICFLRWAVVHYWDYIYIGFVVGVRLWFVEVHPPRLLRFWRHFSSHLCDSKCGLS